MNGAALTQPPSKRSARARKEEGHHHWESGCSQPRVVNRDRSLKRHLHHLIHIVDRSFRYGRGRRCEPTANRPTIHSRPPVPAGFVNYVPRTFFYLERVGLLSHLSKPHFITVLQFIPWNCNLRRTRLILGTVRAPSKINSPTEWAAPTNPETVFGNTTVCHIYLVSCRSRISAPGSRREG